MLISELSSILDEFCTYNSRLYKEDVLKQYKDSQEFINIFRYAYDRLNYTFGVSAAATKSFVRNNNGIDCEVSELIELLQKLSSRELTGNSAKSAVEEFMARNSESASYVLERVLDRDLRIGINVTTFNKIVSKENRIFVPPYMRCSLLNQVHNIKYPAILQTKMDGTYRTIVKEGNEIRTYSRQGEQYEPSNSILETFQRLPEGYYIGELIVDDPNVNRAKSNGLLNSLEVQENVNFYCWDVLSKDEFFGNSKSPSYKERLKRIPDPTGVLKTVESVYVNSYDEAVEQTLKLIVRGEEGSVLKDLDSIFENKTSKYQIKIKPEFDIEVRCTGFLPGKGRRESTFGSMTFVTDDGKIAGQTGSFTDKQLTEISANKDYYIGKVFTLKGNAITKSESSETYAVQYPRFVGFRDDRDDTDTLERAQEIAMSCFQLMGS